MSDLKFSNSLTELPFSKIFFKLAIPNLYSTLIASLTVIFDLWYVGQIGVLQLAGVAYIFPIYMLTSMLSNGAFGGAVSGATARAFGSRDIFQAECVFRSAIVIAFIGSIIMMAIFFTFAEIFFEFFEINKEVTFSALTYGNILLSGIILIWFFNIIIAITRGSGNTIIPAISWSIVLISHVMIASLNFEYKDGMIILIDSINLLGVYVFTSLEWSVISLLMGYLIGVLFVCSFYFFGKHSFSFKTKDFLKFIGILNLIKSGSLASCQSIMTIALAIFCTTVISMFGTNWTAAFGIAIRLELLLIPVIFGVGGALIAIVGANVGAKKYSRAVRMAWKGTFFSVLIVGTIGLFFSIFPHFWSDSFTDIFVIREASNRYLKIVAPFYVFFALGLGLYFTCQAFNTLFWPVIGTLIRLVFVVVMTLILFYLEISNPQSIFIIMSSGLIIYGLFISTSLHFGPWKKYYN
ncbi:MATE family efflux transporter [Candidatus Levibacter sp. Uisw_134_01]|uniref:MATE family efflux transporter n=1 Tax=Candidatus Levibacter sp. Uisw_134_01 TaxID=3230999 RepID=UPI003D55666A